MKRTKKELEEKLAWADGYIEDLLEELDNRNLEINKLKNKEKKETAKDKLKKARQQTLEHLASQMKPEHNICSVCLDNGEECTSCGQGLLAVKRPWTKEELEALDLVDVCEGCTDLTETECIECGKQFACIPKENTLTLNEEDSKLMAELLLNPPEPNKELKAAMAEHKIGNLKSYDEYEEMMGDITSNNSVQKIFDEVEAELKNDKDLSGKTPLELVPLEFLAYAATPVQIGSLKGYQKGSWKEFMPHSKWIAAALRHIIEFQRGKKGDMGLYTEYHPKTGEPIDLPAYHIRAAIFNLCRVQWSLERAIEEEDDR